LYTANYGSSRAESKGGGLAANFGASNQIMGVRRTADFLEKATWTLAGALLVLSILASWVIEKPTEGIKSVSNSKESIL
jgi:preprotein translocase subunit SecG